MLRVPGGHTAAEAVALIESTGAVPEWLVSVGGPESSQVVGALPSFTSYLESGEYVLACVLLDEEGDPHYARGMVRALGVRSRADRPSLADLPPPADTLLFHDFRYTMPAELEAGSQRIWVENRGDKRHHAEIVRLSPGITFASLVEALDRGDQAFPAETVGGLTGLSPGRAGILEVDLVEGSYALICFFFDTDARMPHFKLSMIQMFDVGTSDAAP